MDDREGRREISVLMARHDDNDDHNLLEFQFYFIQENSFTNGR